MALLEVFQGNAKTFPLNFTDDGGNPMNVSGWFIRFTAKVSYSQSNAQAIIDSVVTGVSPEALTGLVYFPLTSGDTAQCPGDYLADFTVTNLSGAPTTFPTEGLRILPTTYVA